MSDTTAPSILNQYYRRLWDSPTLMTWASFVGKSGGLLFVTPLVLTRFNPNEIALWFLFLTIATMLLMADFGFGPSFVRAVSYARGGRRTLEDATDLLSEPNVNLLASIHKALISSYTKLALLVGVLGATLGSWGVAKPVAQLSTPSDGWIAWAVVLVTSCLIFRNSAYSNWLQGLNQVARVRRLEAILAMASTLTTALVILISSRFLVTVIFAQAALVLSSFVIRAVSMRAMKLPSTVSAAERQTVMRFIWPAAWRSGVGSIMSTGAIQSSGIIFAQIAPPSQVAPYLLAMRILQIAISCAMAPFYSNIPHFASLYASGHRATLITNVRKAMGRCYWLYVLATLTVCFTVTPLLHLIHSKTGFVSSDLWLLMTLAFFIERIGAMHMQFYSLSNHILWHIANGVSGTIYLVVSYLLLPICGAYAFPLGIIAGYGGFYTWYSMRLSYRHFCLKVSEFETRCSFVPAAFLIAGLGARMLR